MVRASCPPRSMSESNRASAPRSPESALVKSSAGSDVRLATGLDRHDLGDAVDTIAHDSLDTGFQRLVGCRACSARADKCDFDDASCFVHFFEHDVAAVCLQGGTDDLDGLLYLGLHAH